MKDIILVVIAIFLFSCQSKKNSRTYFGGGIINPISSHILLCQKGVVIDTIDIDKNGHFSYEFDLDEAGLFSFKHGYEFQTFYAEPLDSITLRLNTKEFDESLVFGGNNSQQNNFLIENYLHNQKNSDIIYSYYNIPPIEFERKIDSIRDERIKQLEGIKKKFKISEAYIDIAKHSIAFEYYDMKERYAFLLNKYLPENAKRLSASYFDYREDIDFNNEQVIELIGFQRFLDNYFKNKSIDVCLNTNSRDCYDTGSIRNLDQRIALADSLLEHEFIRKHYFKRFFQEEVMYCTSVEQLKHSKSHLSKFNLTESEKVWLESLVEFQESMLVDQNLQNFKVSDQNFEDMQLKDIITKDRCIIYSWSINSKEHLKQRMNKIKAIKKSHPNVQLIGINIDFDMPQEWQHTLKSYNDNVDNEYQIIPQEHSMFYRNYLNKVLFVDKNGNIKMSETVLSNDEFDTHLENFTNL